MATLRRAVLLMAALAGWLAGDGQAQETVAPTATQNVKDTDRLRWQRLPDLPEPLGVAGPFAGRHDEALIVAGGAHFPQPVWENEKRWRDAIYVLLSTDDGWQWRNAGQLPRPIAYGASVSTPTGVICLGGNDGEETFSDVFELRWDADRQVVERIDLPSLPQPCAYASAALIGSKVYLCGGQSGAGLDSAMNQLWQLDLAARDQPDAFHWTSRAPCPGPPRAFHLSAAQHDGYRTCLYVISGRGPRDDGVAFLTDVWEYNPVADEWRQRADVPVCVMAGTAIDSGQSHLFVLGGADGSRFGREDELKDDHPGFPKRAWAYHTITNTWIDAGTLPINQVTTTAVPWRDGFVLPSGEVRPRVRTPAVWWFRPRTAVQGFGWLNYTVLFAYLAAMVGVGVYFTKQNHSTDDYFRGGKRIPWWAAGCSIFATMLSSLTYTGVPSKAFAQDWTYAIGNAMIPLVAILAVFVALPFYRRIDATSAYEYLERRFHRGVRMFGSASFTLFHVFRMSVVLSLTAFALAVATPLSPAQAVLLMGVLSIIYSTSGGVEAVVWTDTIQTFVLFGGALLAAIFLVQGLDGGFNELVSVGQEENKWRLTNGHWDPYRSQIALWVIVVGAIAQNVSSYTADQAVVQRYMTTADQRLAARSIWTNACLTIPATLLFFGIGTALYAFYRAHPEKLNASMTTDQIFPLYIAEEMPIGLAGLMVAGIFAAAQSTVSTSMNSMSSAVVTDFLRPFGFCHSERSYLVAARWVTLVTGVLGTLLGLLFLDPNIMSLFDAFIKVIGLFMGVLGGLFVLGALTERANGQGAMIGALVGAAAMFSLWAFSKINGYLYTASGITTCVVVGYVASLAFPAGKQDLTGLTIYSMPPRSV